MTHEPQTSRTTVFNPTVIKLGLVSHFADVASEMLYPITPIFLTAVLGASMASLGLVEGVAEGVASLLKASAGAWSDRTGTRKPFFWGGYLLSALAKPLIGVAGAWPAVLGARSLDRVGKGFRTAPRDALLAESVPPELRGSAFGWHRAMDTLGAAIGPLLAVAYLRVHAGDDLRGIYYWSLLPGLVSVLFALAVREARRPAPTVAASAPKPGASFDWRWKDLSPGFKQYLVAWGVFSLANSSDVFLLTRVKQSGAALETVILLYCGYNLVYALASPYLGGLSDRVGRRGLLIFGLAVFAGVYAGFAVASTLPQFAILFAVYGVYMAATDGVGKSLAIDLVPKDLKATGVGVLGAVTGLATIVASVVAGALWDQLGAAWALGYGSVGALVAAGLLSVLPVSVSPRRETAKA